jgi:hypothetical protein
MVFSQSDVMCNPKMTDNAALNEQKTKDKMPTLRKIKRAAMPLLVPTQITTH